MGEIKISSNDLLFGIASVAIITIIASIAIIAIILLFTFGSPLLLISIIAGYGIFGIFLLFGFGVAFLSFWYILYALMKNFFEKKEEQPIDSKKTSYTMDRIKKA